jgi:hypothetical protein
MGNLPGNGHTGMQFALYGDSSPQCGSNCMPIGPMDDVVTTGVGSFRR